ncbi:hypothetical protein LCGC14_2744650 [marine sediment metagenome]|uniref:Uncharacterized protein n=1 Tax=marine sediment metagenome TaxID=412755 RepID=A0A0F9BV57_9ZZZZ
MPYYLLTRLLEFLLCHHGQDPVDVEGVMPGQIFLLVVAPVAEGM